MSQVRRRPNSRAGGGSDRRLVAAWCEGRVPCVTRAHTRAQGKYEEIPHILVLPALATPPVLAPHTARRPARAARHAPPGDDWLDESAERGWGAEGARNLVEGAEERRAAARAVRTPPELASIGAELQLFGIEVRPLYSRDTGRGNSREGVGVEVRPTTCAPATARLVCARRAARRAARAAPLQVHPHRAPPLRGGGQRPSSLSGIELPLPRCACRAARRLPPRRRARASTALRALAAAPAELVLPPLARAERAGARGSKLHDAAKDARTLFRVRTGVRAPSFVSQQMRTLMAARHSPEPRATRARMIGNSLNPMAYARVNGHGTFG